MKKSELKVGEEYAIGSTSRYDHFRASHVKVLDLNAESEGRYGRKTKGILIEFVEDAAGFPFRGFKAGQQSVIRSGREFMAPWVDYAKRKAEHDERRRAHRAEQNRVDEVAIQIVDRLRALGFDATMERYSPEPFKYDGRIIADVDEFKRLLDLIP